MQLKIVEYNNAIFEWIPYNQFDNIKEINITLHSAIWKDGPLYYYKEKYGRKSGNGKVVLKYLYNSQNITNELLIKV